MEIQYVLVLAKGILAGFFLSIPLGPVGLLLVQRTMHKGVKAGMASGLGIATADTFYAIVAAFGLSFITNFFIAQETEMKLIGGVVLLLLGIKIFRTNPAEISTKPARNNGRMGDFFSMFFLTMSNPFMIVLYSGAFTFMGLSIVKDNPSMALTVTLGIYLGATLWWLSISSGVNSLRNRIKLKKLSIVNKTIGGLIILLALIAGISACSSF